MKVYLDNNTTTMMDEQVKDAMEPYAMEKYGDPSSPHNFASDIHMDLEISYEKIYAGINAAKSDNIIITSGMAESNSWIFNSVFFEFIMPGRKDHVIVSQVEHPSVMKAARFLESLGIKVTYVAVDSEGLIDAEDVKSCITSKTALVSITWVNHQTGAISPIEDIAKICREQDIYFHTDATHAIGKVRINMQAFKGIDFLTFSADIIHGPKGVGALFVKQGRELRPMIHGDQMDGLRGDTLNVAGIVGMGKALELAIDAIDFDMPDVEELRDELEDELLEMDGTFAVTPRDKRVENNLLISFEGVNSKSLVWELSQAGIAANIEEAYLSKDQFYPTIMDAVGSKDNLSYTAIRFSLSRYTTQEEIKYTIEVTKKAVKKLREISGYEGA